jgi:hypothetical protein
VDELHDGRRVDVIELVDPDPGTALKIRPRLTAFVTYDKRLADAAVSAGLSVDMAH